MTPPDNKLPDPNDLQKFFEGWWRTGVSIGTTIASALGSLKIPEPANYIIAGAITIAGLAISVFIYRRDARQREKAKEQQQKIEPVVAAGAFRGLKRFLRGDVLPGPGRRTQAAQLARQIVHPNFKIALITGDSGAGKSSMLECAVAKSLEDAGHPVVMISNSGELGLSSSAAASGSSSQIEAAISEIACGVTRSRIEGGKPVVVILDQFEELLSRFRSANDRKALSEGLWRIIGDGVRVIIGIRKEYLVDFKSMSAGPNHVVSFQDTFLVENLETKEAAGIIQECANQDHIQFDPDLPELIADDLAIDEKVRPADLQIVCTALSGDLTVDRYRSAGRAAGLRSRFVKGVIDITGDAILTRSVLRQLCDISNNKKAEPLRAEDIAEKARAGAPGERATLAAVTSILRELEQARVVTRIESADGPRWSLIHDYLVEPIKIATEEQNTRSETAAARLDYFVTRAKASGALIPLSDLRLIQRDAPPAALKQPAARGLIRRSLLVGYGTPTVGALAAALVAVSLVIFATTERQWTVVDEKNHWDGVDSGKRNERVVGQLVQLEGRPNKQTVVVGPNLWYGPGRLTTWDAETGAFLGALSGTLAGQSILSYDANTGRLSKHDAAGKEVWGVTTPSEGRPPYKIAVSYFDDPYVYFSDANHLSLDAVSIIFSVKSKKWIVLTPDKVDPVPAPAKRPSYDSEETKFLHVHLVTKGNLARITIWTADYEQLLFDEQSEFDDKIENSIRILALTDLGARTILSFAKGRTINCITIVHSLEDPNETPRKFTVGERKQIPLPNELILSANRLFPRSEGNQVIVSLGNRIVIVEPLAKRTFFWVFNPAASSFDERIIGAQSAYIGPGYAWMPEDDDGPARFWFPENSEPLRMNGIRIRSKDSIWLSQDKRHALVISDEGVGDLWDTDFSAGKASSHLRITAPNKSRLFPSGDEQLVMRRQPGGLHEAWDLDGAPLGSLGTLGSEVQVSSYRKDCRQILLWTSEGQRLDFGEDLTYLWLGSYLNEIARSKYRWFEN